MSTRLPDIKGKRGETLKLSDLVGKGPFAFTISVVVLVLSYWLDSVLAIEVMSKWQRMQTMLGVVLLLATFIVFIYAFKHLTLSKHNRVLVKSGPYAYVRHPRYSCIVFLAYPAVALLLHSMTSLVCTFFVYCVFRYAAAQEEKNLLKIFGGEYEEYMGSTPAFIPTSWRRNGKMEHGASAAE